MQVNASSVSRYGALAFAASTGVVLIGVGLQHGPLSQGGFMPHGHCYLWKPELVWLHVGSDLLIGTAYVAISAMLAYLVYRARSEIPFGWMMLAFGLFIVMCGATHFMEVWTLWIPVYWLSGEVKLVTAAASVATAVALPPLIPAALALIESGKRSEERRAMLERSNGELNEQIVERHRAEEALREVQRSLEARVLARTEELRQLAAENARLYEAERAARATAETANRLKDEFLATVSHELRTPLTPMLAWTRMLRIGSLDQAATQAAIASIERNVRSQSQLVDDLLDGARITSGKLRFEERPVELGPIVEAALETVSAAAAAKDIRVAVALDADCGSVFGDPERLRQVVWNLLSNAIKFTPRGGHVDVRLQRCDASMVLTVRDDGAGITPQFLPYIFERFRQDDSSSSRSHGGLGVGLTIVKHIVELHGGMVVAESAGTGRGAAFTVTLPVLSEARARAERVLASRPAHDDAPGPSLAGVRVVAVDDEADTLEVVCALLREAGAEVRGVSSAAEALAAAAESTPDILVSDISMPGEDGYALIAKIRAAERAGRGRLPAIALTAYARVEDRLRVLAAGFQMHVPKPIDPLELVTVVASVVGGTRPSSSAES